MPIWETVLIYLVAPLGITIVIAVWGLISRTPKHNYYTLDQKWTHDPIWWGAVDEAPWRAHGAPAVTAGASGGAASGKW